MSKEHVVCCRAAIQDSTKHCHCQSPGEAKSVVAKQPGTSDPQEKKVLRMGREDIQC